MHKEFHGKQWLPGTERKIHLRIIFFFSERATTFEGKIMVMTEKK